MTAGAPHHDVFHIEIDHDRFTVEGPTATGAELRALPKPPVGPDRDLWLEVPGPEPDQLIEPDTVLELRDGMHFFTAPSHITPGRHAASGR